jgi:rhomboid protease GluP
VSCGYLVGVKDDKCYHCGRRNPALFGFAPALRSLGHDLGFVPFVTGFCILMFLVSILVGGGPSMGGGLFGFLAPRGNGILGSSGVVPVVELHRWWTLLSASWLHGSLLHLLMNLYGIRFLAPAVGELYGPGRMVIIYVLGGAAGLALSTAAGSFLSGLPPPFGGGASTVGASASLLGLMGALLYYGHRTGSRLIHSQVLTWAISQLVFGLLVPGVDNYAHAGGFAGGYLVARLLDPLKGEQINHIVVAVGLLVLSVLSILASFVHYIYLTRLG